MVVHECDRHQGDIPVGQLMRFEHSMVQVPHGAEAAGNPRWDVGR